MIVLWMVYALVVGALLAVAAWTAEEAMRAWRLPTRWVWFAALILMVGLPVAAGARGMDRGASERTIATAVGIAGGDVEPGSPAAAYAPAADAPGSGFRIESGLARAAEGVGVERLRSLDPVAAAAWGLATAGLLSLLVWTAARARSGRSRWPLRRVVGEMVRVAPGAGPAVQGIRHPEIILPEWLLARSESEIRLAVAHEREHVRAGDPRLLMAGWTLAALLPWNPLVWWTYSRMRLAVEIDCDRRVLASGAAWMAYGSMLVDVASRGPAAALAGATGLIGAPSHLERRIGAMTSRIRHARVRVGGFGALAALMLAVACNTGMPTADEIEAMDLAMAEDRAADFLRATGGDGQVEYVVDGVIVDRDTAAAIEPDRIESISVVRGVEALDVDGEARDRVIEIRTLSTMVGNGSRSADDWPNAPAPSRTPDSGSLAQSTAGGAPGNAVPSAVTLSGQVILSTVRGVPDSSIPSTADQAMTTPAADTIPVQRLVLGMAGPGNPLIVVDGVIVRGALDIDTTEIESIEVIKATAAERLYGSRGANGVIHVITRGGAARQD